MGKRFFERIKYKYKILILNEVTFEEKFNFRLSALNLFLYTSVFTVISFAIISLLIFFTPLKHYLPGYADVSVKGELLKESMRVDSLMANLEFQEKQFEMIKLIIRDEIAIDSIEKIDSVTLASWADLPLDKSESEQAFARQYEQDAKYNLSTIDIDNTPKTSLANIFMQPTNGVLIDSISNNNYGVSIATKKNSSVIAITEGTIIYTNMYTNKGYTVMLQHKNGFLSVYKNIERLLKYEGDHVNTGEVFAFVGDTKKDNKAPFTFELWLDGKAQSPTDYIVF